MSKVIGRKKVAVFLLKVYYSNRSIIVVKHTKYKKLIILQHRVRATKSHIQNSTNQIFFLG